MQQKILIVGPSWVGDMVMAQALFRLLKLQDPDVIIDVLASEKLHPLLKHMGEVRKSIILPFVHNELNILGRYRIGLNLRSEGYDRAIILPNSFKSALIPFFAGILRRVGWLGEMRYFLLNDMRILEKDKFPLMVERFLALGLNANESLPKKHLYPMLETDESSVKNTLHKLCINLKNAPLLALCPGAEYGPSKQWPAEYFAKVADIKAKEGWNIILLGSAKDQKITSEIQRLSNGVCLDMAGKTDLSDTVDILSIADCVISNDSGLMHIASALNRPLVAIYGSSSPAFTPPLGSRAKILYLNLPCGPCFKRTCQLGHLDCMCLLRPELVLQYIGNL